MGYTLFVYEIRKTEFFAKWIDRLKDTKAKARILVRLSRLEQGLFGDVKPVGSGVSELRITYGPGYRVYFKKHKKYVIILLVGGDKKSQPKDIQKAIEIANQLED